MKTIPIVVQNIDRNIRRHDYDQFDGKLLVTSWFRTIQGEGPYAGRPAVFLRLAGCNLGSKQDLCAWCDTSFQFDKGTAFEFSDLMMELTSLPGYNEKDILVVTGGEPTLQDSLLDFISGVGDMFARVQVETNGTQAAFFKQMEDMEESLGDEPEEMLPYVRPSIVVSPKGSTVAGRIPEPSPLVLRYASCLKFVVTAEEDDPHHTVPEWAVNYHNEGGIVYVSPMCQYLRAYTGEISSIWDATLVNQEATARNYEYAARYAMENNFYLSLQTHLFTAIP
jgi:7-carboxy-7-deazaguanine synthase